jgi:uncharacterized protein YwgA
MTAFEFVLLLVGALPERRIEGRTKLQKVGYFFGLQLGIGRSLAYRPHFYGPYSAEVAEAASMLVALGFLTESVLPGAVDEKGFERKKYVYALTEEGEKAVVILSKRVDPGFINKLENAVQTLQSVIKTDHMPLSCAAKVFWHTKGQDIPETDIQKKAGTTGWELDESQISGAVGFLQELRDSGFQPA